MENETSINPISGDNIKELLPLKWIIWLILNFINNNFQPKNPEFNKYNFVKQFKPKISNSEWQEIYDETLKSPSRILCNLFWKKINFFKVKQELGKINILDTGCGDGYYALKLNKYWEGINSYLGIDNFYSKTWKFLSEKYSFTSFIKTSYLDINKFIPNGTNLFISQSAIEHFRYDLKYFNQINEYINLKKINTIQIHLFPAPACLWLYIFHGFRQYNFNSILKIINIFKGPNTYFKIYLLGGPNSNNLHFKSITIPHFVFRDIFKVNKVKYLRNLKKSIYKDNLIKTKNPTFYALIIHSNFKNKIF